MRSGNRIALIFYFLLVFGLSAGFSLKAQNLNNYYKEVIDKIPVDTDTSAYLKDLANIDEPKLSLAENAGLAGFDLIVSLVCLITALLIPIQKDVTLKGFLWFILSINIFWLLSQVFMRLGWGMMNYCILRLQPDYLGATINAFYYISLFLGLGVFNWLIARNFGVGFFGAVKVLFISSLIYFILTSVVLTAIPWQNNYFSLVKNNLGAKQSLSAYLWDVKNIAAGKSILPSARFRVFHL